MIYFNEYERLIWKMIRINSEILKFKALFITPGMQRRGTSRHLCIYTYIVAYLLIILQSRFCCILYFILFHYMSTKNCKHYYNHRNHLVFKYAFNDEDIGLLVLEHKIYQQRLCTLSKKVMILHPFTVLFMIFNFKNDLLFINILNILK